MLEKAGVTEKGGGRREKGQSLVSVCVCAHVRDWAEGAMETRGQILTAIFDACSREEQDSAGTEVDARRRRAAVRPAGDMGVPFGASGFDNPSSR